jgi:hypothetical protein
MPIDAVDRLVIAAMVVSTEGRSSHHRERPAAALALHQRHATV